MNDEQRKKLFGADVVIMTNKEIDNVVQFRKKFLDDIKKEGGDDLLAISRMGTRIGALIDAFTDILTRLEKEHPVEANIMLKHTPIKGLLLLIHKSNTEYKQFLTRMEIL